MVIAAVSEGHCRESFVLLGLYATVFLRIRPPNVVADESHEGSMELPQSEERQDIVLREATTAR